MVTMRALRSVRAGELLKMADIASCRPTMAEYLARRELALDYLARWRSEDLGGDSGLPEIALRAAKSTQYLSRTYWPNPRDKTPLPLP